MIKHKNLSLSYVQLYENLKLIRIISHEIIFIENLLGH